MPGVMLNSRIRAGIAVTFVVLLCCGPVAAAGSAPTMDPQPPMDILTVEQLHNRIKVPSSNAYPVRQPIRRIDRTLQAVAEAASSVAAYRSKSRQTSANTESPQYDDQGRVQVTLHFDSGFDGPRVITASGGLVEVYLPERGRALAWVHPSELTRLSLADGIVFVGMPTYGHSNAGSVEAQDQEPLQIPQLRAQGADGSGVRIGVISDGVESLFQAQASGDLPANLVVLQGCRSGDTSDGICDEGTAMLEILHDIAPQATLGFCGGSSQTDSAPSSLAFIDCGRRLLGPEFGADIILDDISFFSEPMMEDGLVASFVQSVADSGTPWVTSAGNNGGIERRQFYSAVYQPLINNCPVGQSCAFQVGTKLYDSFNDFGATAGGDSDTANAMTVEPNSTIRVVLQWNDPYSNATNDYDLFLFDRRTNELLASSTATQQGSPAVPPVESLIYANTGTVAESVDLMVARAPGSSTRRISILGCFLATADCNLTYANSSGQIFGHAGVPGAITVGALTRNRSGTVLLEGFSSQGPVEIFVPAFERRTKPDFAAFNRVNVSGAGGFPKEFVGTSASAPYIAGILALMASIADGDITTALKQSAVDLGDAGRDNVFGYGLPDAVAAAALAANLPVDSPGSGNIDPGGGSTDSSGQSEASAMTAPLLLVFVGLILIRNDLRRAQRNGQAW